VIENEALNSRQHIEMLDIAFAFDRFPGFEKVSSYFMALLSPGQGLTKAITPWTRKTAPPELSFDSNIGPIGFALNSKTGALTRKAFSINKKLLGSSCNPLNAESTTTWNVVASDDDITKLVKSTISAPDSSVRQIGTVPFTDWLQYLDISERSFSVVMMHKSAKTCISAESKLLNFEPDVLQRALNLDSPFLTDFGDHFMSGWTRQRCFLAVYNIRVKKVADFKPLSDELAKKLGADPKDVKAGCKYLAEMAPRHGYHCNVTVLKSDLPTAGLKVIRDKDQVLGTIANTVGDILDADAVLSELELHSFRDRIPQLPVSRLDTFSTDLSQKRARDRVNFLAAAVVINARCKDSPFREDTEANRKRLVAVEDLISDITSKEGELTGTGYEDSQLKHLEDLLDLAQDAVDLPLAARSWVRQSIQAEIK
jgi:hypothetical protein